MKNSNSHERGKKRIALLLAVIMLLACLPINAMAGRRYEDIREVLDDGWLDEGGDPFLEDDPFEEYPDHPEGWEDEYEDDWRDEWEDEWREDWDFPGLDEGWDYSAIIEELAELPIGPEWEAAARAERGTPIDMDNLPAGVIGAKIVDDSTTALYCGHDFEFEMLFDAAPFKVPFDMIIVFDKSGSMNQTTGKWDAAKGAAKAAIRVVDDYNKGNLVNSLTSNSRFGFVAYDDDIMTMSGTSITTSGSNTPRFNYTTTTSHNNQLTATTSLINPSLTTNSYSNLTLAENAIQNLSASGGTNIANAIAVAINTLKARTIIEEENRPAFIIVMTDGGANSPYSYLVTHPSNHSGDTIGDSVIRTYLSGTLNVPNSTQCTTSGNPTMHTCNTAAAILRAREAHTWLDAAPPTDAKKTTNYDVYSVGFMLDILPGAYGTSTVDPNAVATAKDTLQRIADEGGGTATFVDSGNKTTQQITDELKTAFENIVLNYVDSINKPPASDGFLHYEAPAGFTIQSAALIAGHSTYSNGDLVIALDGKSFDFDCGPAPGTIYDNEPFVFKIALQASPVLTPGLYDLVGPGSYLSFTNVKYNVPVSQPAWYTGTHPDYTIDLQAWTDGQGKITVLPMAYDATASLTIGKTANSFTVYAGDLSPTPFPFPPGGALTTPGYTVFDDGSSFDDYIDAFNPGYQRGEVLWKNSSNVWIKVGTFTEDGAGLKITLDSPPPAGFEIPEEPGTETLKLAYTYTWNDLESCPKTLLIDVTRSEVTIDITVKKIWQDIAGNPTTTDIPASVVFQLWYRLVDPNDYDPADPAFEPMKDDSNDPITLTLPISGIWEGTFDELPTTGPDGTVYEYKVVEVAVPGYLPVKNGSLGTYPAEELVDNGEPEISFTNRRKSIDIPVEKIWIDGGYDGRPIEIGVELFHRLKSAAPDGPYDVNTKLISLNKNTSPAWKGTFVGLPETDKDGNEYEYKVVEIGVPSGYKTVVTGDQTSGFTITNTLLCEITVKKIFGGLGTPTGFAAIFTITEIDGNGDDVVDGYTDSIEFKDMSLGTWTVTGLSPGIYKVTELITNLDTGKSEWKETTFVVTGLAEGDSGDGFTAEVTLDPGDKATVTFTNVYRTKLEIHKIDEDDEDLPGVGFTLYKVGLLDTGVGTGITDEYGELSFWIEETGDYYLKETGALQNYKYFVDKIEFSVDSDGTIVFNDSAWPSDKVWLEGDTITVRNIFEYKLEGTGGPGSHIFTAVGAAVSAIVVIILYYFMKEGRRKRVF